MWSLNSPPNYVYKKLDDLCPCFFYRAVIGVFLDALRQLFLLSTILVVKYSFTCLRNTHLELRLVDTLIGRRHRYVEVGLCKLPGHCSYVRPSQIISCLPKKVLCQVTKAITVMSIWIYDGYNVHQSFLSIWNNNDIALYVYYLIFQLHEKASPIYPCFPAPQWQTQ